MVNCLIISSVHSVHPDVILMFCDMMIFLAKLISREMNIGLLVDWMSHQSDFIKQCFAKPLIGTEIFIEKNSLFI